MSRRKANTAINLSLQFLDVQALHGKTVANAVVEAYIEIVISVNYTLFFLTISCYLVFLYKLLSLKMCFEHFCYI